MWDLPGPGLEPVSPALAGRFLTTEPPGKSYHTVLISVALEYILKLETLSPPTLFLSNLIWNGSFVFTHKF